MRSLYTDKETDELIEKLKSKDDNFNLSSFLKRALVNHLGDNSNLDVIKRNLEDCRLTIEKYNNELKYWQELEKKAILQEELSKLKKEEETKQKAAAEERKQQLRKNRTEFTQMIAKQELNRQLNNDELDEFLNGIEDGTYSHINQYIQRYK
jgi:ribosome recycling factor